MASGDEERGTSRLLIKLKEAFDNSKYYEAHQLVKTINFRYQSANKILELERILVNAGNTLLDNKQYESGSDIGNMLTKLYLEHNILVQEERMNQLTQLVGKMRDSPERTMFIANTIEWSTKELENSGDFNSEVTKIYIQEGLYQEAWKHLIRMSNAPLISKLTLDIISKTQIEPQEVDLVVAILIFSLIAGKRLFIAEQVFAELMRTTPAINITPLINGVRFLIEASKSPNMSVFKSLRQIYMPSFNREQNIPRLVTAIGKIIFRIPDPAKNSGRTGIMAHLFSALAQPESSQGNTPGPSSQPQAETLTLD